MATEPGRPPPLSYYDKIGAYCSFALAGAAYLWKLSGGNPPIDPAYLLGFGLLLLGLSWLHWYYDRPKE